VALEGASLHYLEGILALISTHDCLLICPKSLFLVEVFNVDLGKINTSRDSIVTSQLLIRIPLVGCRILDEIFQIAPMSVIKKLILNLMLQLNVFSLMVLS
jgi:hypothetical protein